MLLLSVATFILNALCNYLSVFIVTTFICLHHFNLSYIYSLYLKEKQYTTNYHKQFSTNKKDIFIINITLVRLYFEF